MVRAGPHRDEGSPVKGLASAVIGTHEGGVGYCQQMLATDRGYLQPAN